MYFKIVLPLFLVLSNAVLALPGVFGHGSKSPCVHTATSTIYGTINSTFPRVEEYQGIPFALPPTGNLRFAAPQKAPPQKVINATQAAPACPQYIHPATIFDILVPEIDPIDDFSEDCLTLGVYKPAGCDPKKKLPVFIWVFGGGFTIGGDQTYTDPKPLVERKQDIIVVTLNYRVNMFGFPNTPLIPAQNPGLLDQRLGVEWVRDNIAAFGGDVTRMTWIGHSAGAESGGYFPFAYPNDPIINGLILTSGTEMTPSGSSDYAGTNFTYVAGQVGCGNLSGPNELDCVRKVPWETIEKALFAAGTSRTDRLSFQPIPDNITYFSNYTARGLAGKFANISAIIGTNRNEGESLEDTSASMMAPNQTLVEEVTYGGFVCPALQTSKIRYYNNYTTFRYEYAGNFTNISPLPWMGAYHQSNMPIMFGTHYEYNGPSTPFEWDVANTMQDLFVAFAHDPPNAAMNLPKLGWPLNENGTDKVLLFAADKKVTQIEKGVYGQKICPLIAKLEADGSNSSGAGDNST